MSFPTCHQRIYTCNEKKGLLLQDLNWKGRREESKHKASRARSAPALFGRLFCSSTLPLEPSHAGKGHRKLYWHKKTRNWRPLALFLSFFFLIISLWALPIIISGPSLSLSDKCLKSFQRQDRSYIMRYKWCECGWHVCWWKKTLFLLLSLLY